MQVKAAEPGTVALWEVHPAHPGGEVFIASEKPVEAALTPAVKARLKDGRLLAVDGDLPPAAEPVATESPDATDAARELAAEHDIDLAAITGTGADGRILKSDVEALL